MAEPKNFERWKVVVLSFVGAATFWFFSALGKEYSYRFRHPIEFTYNRDSLIAIKPLPEFVDIDVTGGGWDLFRGTYWFGRDPIIFDLENPAAIRYLTRPTILPILTDQLSQFRVNFLFTDTLFIDIDRKDYREVTLSVDSANVSLDPDYRITSQISLEPERVIISGPESFLDTLSEVYIVPVEADEIDRAFDRFVKLGLPERYDISSDPPTVNLKFDVERFEQFMMPTSVELLGFPSDSSVFVEDPEVDIYFLVRESLKSEYFEEDFKVIVDYSMIDRLDSTAPAIIMFHPENLQDLEVSPDSLKITYVK